MRGHAAPEPVELPWFLVFTGRKWKTPFGQTGITWEPAGVWQAEDEHNACLVAAQATGAGTCFAVSGFAWGVDVMEPGRTRQLGVAMDPMERLERTARDLGERLANALPAGERDRRVLLPGDVDE